MPALPQVPVLRASAMIFVTLGMENFPFPRLLEAVAEAVTEGVISKPVLVQNGSTAYDSPWLEQRRLYDFSEMESLISDALIVVGHAGTGTVLLARQLGRRPLVMPREQRRGEHLNDHQQDFARRLAKSGQAHVAWNKEELKRLLAELRAKPEMTRLDPYFPTRARLTARLAELIAELNRHPPT